MFPLPMLAALDFQAGSAKKTSNELIKLAGVVPAKNSCARFALLF